MFEGISEIGQNGGVPVRKWTVVLRWAMVIAVSGLLFGGLYLIVQHVEL